MEFTWMKTFLLAAEIGNFRKTADALYISQPTVTVHIKQLEKELGVLLFQREGKKIKLTEAGRRYYKHVKKLLAVHEQARQDLQSFTQGYTTELILAISPLIADTILPYVLKQYVKKHPDVEVSVQIIDSVDIENAVFSENVDLGLSVLESYHPDLETTLLSKDKIILVAPHDGRDFESAYPLDEEEILSTNRLLTHNHPGYWEALCKKIMHIYPKTKMMKVSHSHITKRFIVEGLGVSYLPSSTVRRELLEGRLLEVESKIVPLPEAETFAIMKYRHQKQSEFLAFLSQFRL
ncbi:LysR family transcriptional regulator [Bacillus sp. 2205SS5-2]|uniref:LysR family transcriptional regulator n=1 Tax=Bacillus sp. 2205SS5-2 TaxID=3109031 RepID=UPI003006993D